jgi:voltage-gated potassium channel
LHLGDVEQDSSGWQFAVQNGGSPIFTLTYPDRRRADMARKQIGDALKGSLRVGAWKDRTAASSASARSETHSAPQVGFRQWVYTLLEEGQPESTTGRFVEIFLIVLIVANVAAVALESVPSIGAQFHRFFTAFEEFSLVAYTLEYVARLWSATEDPRVSAKGPIRGRVLFALRPLVIVDFIAFAPSYLGLFFGIDLRVLRIFRLFRLLKLARYSQALQALLGVLLAERSALFASIILLLSMMCLEGELMHLAEGSIQPSVLGTMPNAMYWALTTLTTVGYGDITPQTALGKMIAGTTMVTGLALFALPIGIIANGFVTGLSRRRFAITWSMLRRQPLLQGFSVEALNDIVETATAAVLREHAQLTLAGREATDFYLIVSGTAQAESESSAIEIGPGDMIGEEALHNSGSYRRTVTALTPMHVIVLPGDELRRLARKYPALCSRLQQALAYANEAVSTPDLEARLKALESENEQLRRALADLALKKFLFRDQPSIA